MLGVETSVFSSSILLALNLAVSSAVCELPTSGTWTLHEESFVAALSEGDPEAAESIRQAFFIDSKPSTWMFEGDKGTFDVNTSIVNVILKKTKDCKVELYDSTGSNPAVVDLSNIENGFCFTYSYENAETHTECFTKPIK